jgi:hypothetical protein
MLRQHHGDMRAHALTELLPRPRHSVATLTVCSVHIGKHKVAGSTQLQDARLMHQVNDRHHISIGGVAAFWAGYCDVPVGAGGGGACSVGERSQGRRGAARKEGFMCWLLAAATKAWMLACHTHRLASLHPTHRTPPQTLPSRHAVLCLPTLLGGQQHQVSKAAIRTRSLGYFEGVALQTLKLWTKCKVPLQHYRSVSSAGGQRSQQLLAGADIDSGWG